MQHLTDIQLVKRTLQRRGDASLAFAKLYGRYQAKIAAYIAAKVSYNPSLVDDVLQDTFMTAWHKLEQLKEHDKFFPWVVTIARNTAMDVLREKKRVDDISHLLNQEEPETETEEELDLGATEKMLVNLDPVDREIVVMKAVLECSFEEISAQLGLALSASKMRYYRALDKVKSEVSL